MSPTDLAVRIAYSFGDDGLTSDREAEFDRWLREVRAAAWDEGYRKGNLDGYFGTNNEKNPYRAEVSS